MVDNVAPKQTLGKRPSMEDVVFECKRWMIAKMAIEF